MLRERKLGDLGDKFAANRYEGISTGMRWAAEDIEKLL